MVKLPGVSCVVAWSVAMSVAGCAQAPASPPPPANSVLATAVAWKETAAEYDALFLQGFNIARLHVERALAERGASRSSRQLAVVTDLTDTALDTRDYWREAIAYGDQFLNEDRWQTWLTKNRVRAAPGAAQFLEFCRASGVEVFYVSSRHLGDDALAVAIGNLTTAGLPFADAAHVTVLTEDSNTDPRHREIEASRDVVVYLGDSLNDFSHAYFLSHFESRRELLAADREKFGHRFVLFPNPTDGQWIRAIFGEDGPPPTPANINRLHRLIGRP